MIKHARPTYLFKPTEEFRNYIGRFDLFEQSDRYEIWSLSIMGKYRNKGYGKQMLRDFLEQFKSDKPLFLYVYKTNEIAIRLYESVGFTIVGDFSNDAYKMQYMGNK